VAALAEQQRQLQTLLTERHAAFAELDAAFAELDAAFAAVNQHRQSLEESLLERDAALATATATTREREAELQALRQSLSWRLTGPLRRAKRLVQ
jgi:chromosome segregation ATPase